MSDEPDGQPRVRVLDKTAQAEREWVSEEAERRASRWEKRSRQLNSDRRIARAGLTALELHRQNAERAARLSTVAAGNVEPSRGGGDGAGPPRQQTLEDDPRWREHAHVIRRRLELQAQMLDEAEGHGAVAASTMLKEEKDRLIISEGRGYSCDAVVDLLGREVAGSSRTVWRVRREAGVSTVDGEPLPDRDDPRVRRVVVDER